MTKTEKKSCFIIFVRLYSRADFRLIYGEIVQRAKRFVEHIAIADRQPEERRTFIQNLL